MWWFHDAGGWWLWAAMPMAMLTLWGVALWAFVRLVAGPDPGTERPSSAPGPEEVLARRYAGGDIDAEEHRKDPATLRPRTEDRGLGLHRAPRSEASGCTA